MVAMTKAPPTWSDTRLAEVTARKAAEPTAFGAQAAAWRCAAASFGEAHRAVVNGQPERAIELRRSGFKVLHDAGLRVEQAMTAQHPDDAADPGRAAPAPGVTRAGMVTECTARMIWLRDQADAAPPHFAERACAQYAAAAGYERAVREWNRNQAEAAGTWMRSAEQMLGAHVVPAPWHKQLESQTAT
jgi:hypothetical protein